MDMVIKDKEDSTKIMSEEDKTRLTEEVRKVMDYCTNISRCRRVQVLQYFGEKFHAKDCHQSCDVCLDDASVTTRDVTTESIAAINLVKSMTGNNTMNHCKAVFMGSKKKDVMQRGHNMLSGYGKGSNFGQKATDQLFEELVSVGALREAAVSNNSGWSNNYMMVSDSEIF